MAETITLDTHQSVNATGLLKLKIKNPTESKIAKWLNTLQETGFFNELEKMNLKNWSINFPIEVFEKESMNDTALQALCYLISEVMNPILLRVGVVKDSTKLFDVYEEIKSMMERHLPKGIDVETYLQNYEDNLYVEQLEKQKIDLSEKPIEKLGLKERVLDLIQSMQQSNSFSSEDKEIINVSYEEIPGLFFDLANDANREMASLAICLILCDVVEPVLYKTSDEDARKELIGFELELNEILNLSLTLNQTVDECTKTYRHFSVEARLIREKLQLIETVFNDAMDKLYEDANAADLKIIASDDLDNKKLLSLIKERTLTLDNVNSQFETLTNKINISMDVLQQDATHLELISDKLQGVYACNHELIQNCQSTFKDFKV